MTDDTLELTAIRATIHAGNLAEDVLWSKAAHNAAEAAKNAPEKGVWLNSDEEILAFFCSE